MLVAETTEITEALAQVSAGLDRLLRADIEGLDGVGIGTVFDWLEVERRRLDAVDVRVISTIEERRRDGEFAAATVVDMLVNRQHVDAADAQRRANRAFELRTRHTLIGEELPPLLPRAAIALADGAISAKHVDVVAKYVDKVDQLSDVVPESAEIAEQLLVEASRHESPKAVARLGEALLARLDPDGSAPRDVDLDRERGYSLVKKPDGSSLPRGCLTPEATAAWEALFDALAAPATDADGSLDPRTPAQRRHDAMLDADLRCSGIGVTAHGSLISLAGLAPDLCESEVAATVVNEAGAVLAFGRSRRLATRAQRLALAARDGGCCFPGCAPAGMDRSTPRDSVVARRQNRSGESVSLVSLPSSAFRTALLGRRDDRRGAGVDSATLGRPGPKTGPQHRTSPRLRLPRMRVCAEAACPGAAMGTME